MPAIMGRPASISFLISAAVRQRPSSFLDPIAAIFFWLAAGGYTCNIRCRFSHELPPVWAQASGNDKHAGYPTETMPHWYSLSVSVNAGGFNPAGVHGSYAGTLWYLKIISPTVSQHHIEFLWKS